MGGGAAHRAVRVVAVCVLVAACASTRIPPALRGYDVLVERRDPQAAELARALRDLGLRVRREVRGGSHPTAALVFFTFADPAGGSAPNQGQWLHVRLADTRSGLIVAAASILLDSVGPTPRARADAAVRALASP